MIFIRRTILTIFWSFFAIVCGIGLISAAIFLYLGPSLPSVDTIRTIKLQTPLRIYSGDNKLIDEYGEVRRTPVQFDQIPPQFIQALIAVEDRRFETHIGVDAKGFTRAMVEFLSSGQKGGGGSTLTQQVAKNYFLSNEKLFTRKFREILLALQMERLLTKQEIFELYVNKTFLGHRAYGIQAAAQVYYGRDINDLRLPELAMLAGLPQRPSFANPISYPENAIKRRNQVLADMRQMKYITQASYERAVNSPLTASYFGDNPEVSAPWVGEMARDYMVERFGVDAYNNGYRVFTTVDSRLQNEASLSVQRGLLEYDRRHGFRGAYRILTFTEGEQVDEVLTNWANDLQQDIRYGGLRSAAIIGINEQSFVALLSDRSQVTVEWDDMKWARRYLTESNTGPEPELASEIVNIGDVVWLKQEEQRWTLSQLPEAQAALVALNPNTGAIISLVGGFDFRQSKYNRVTQAKRQPGSNIKGFLYAAALEQGLTPATIINDAPITLVDPVLETTWRPKNSGYIFDGPIRLREALYRSKNVVSIRLLQQIGVGRTINYMTRFGLDPESLPKNLTLALGSASLTPMSIASGYTVLANGGYRVPPYFIQRIEDRDGNIIFEANQPIICPACVERENLNDEEQALLAQLNEEQAEIMETPIPLAGETTNEPTSPVIKAKPVYAQQVISPQVAYMMNSILQDVITEGTGRLAKSLGRSDLAGKTGTTNDGQDAWFTGFNADLVASAWVGFDQPASLGAREWGGSAALPIWIDFMKDALKGKPESTMPQPDGMVTVRIDPDSGLLARPGQRNGIFEVFPQGLAPTEYAQRMEVIPVEETEEDLLRSIEGDSSSGSENTAPELLF